MDEQADVPPGEDRGISVGRDASGNAFVTGDNNQVRVVIYQSVAECREAEEPLETEIGPNPYMGLLAFHEEDAARFFGRETQITRLWDKLQDLQQPLPGQLRPRLLPILGPSGSGKSSLARAGLIPELARRPLPGWKDSRVAVFTPGAHPLEALAGVLARIATGDAAPVEKTAEFERGLKRKNDDGQYDGLRRIADALPEIARVRLIVLVDQFEEIYSLCDDQTEQMAFIENLLCAAGDAGGRATVVITLRTDFLGETQTHEVLNRVICEQQVMVPAMNEAELRAAIAKPAELAGQPLDDGTVVLLVSDAKDREGALPLLQFALTRIWDGMTRNVAPSKTYQEIGGVGGALAGEAQRIYDQLGDAEQRIAKRVFLGLVQLGEGTRDTRRRAVVEDLVAMGEDASEVERVIRRFAGHDARLITLSSDERGRADTAEVTHEALFDHWDQLNQWLDENREDIRFSRRLDEAAHTWDRQGRPEGGLWRRPNLDLLRGFHQRGGMEMNPLQMNFFIASVQAEQQRKDEEERRRRHDTEVAETIAETERQRAEEQKRRVRQFKIAAVVASVLLAVSAGLLVYSMNVSRRAQAGEIDAQAGEIDAFIDTILLSPPAMARERIKRLTQAAESSSLQEYAVQELRAALDKPPPDASRDELNVLASGKANLAVALTKFGETDPVWPQLKPSDGDPTLRTYLIHRFAPAGADAEVIAGQVAVERDPSILQALILSLGEFKEVVLTKPQRQALIPKLVELYRDHPHPGVHAASEWLLRLWEQTDKLAQLADSLRETEQQLQSREPTDTRRWYVNSQHTMVIIKGPVKFELGSPASEEGNEGARERLQTIEIPWSFAIADQEVTLADSGQFLRDPDYRECLGMEREGVPGDATSHHTARLVSWYMAAAYCNWLTEQELGKAEAQDELVYARNNDNKFAKGMTIASDFNKRTGYRLPTEAEWEYACRALTRTRWSHGEAEELLGMYAWYDKNSREQSHVIRDRKPNGLGLFDSHGNVWEWCQDEYHANYTLKPQEGDLTLDEHTPRVLRGGSFNDDASWARGASRNNDLPVNRVLNFGFRLARTYP